MGVNIVHRVIVQRGSQTGRPLHMYCRSSQVLCLWTDTHLLHFPRHLERGDQSLFVEVVPRPTQCLNIDLVRDSGPYLKRVGLSRYRIRSTF